MIEPLPEIMAAIDHLEPVAGVNQVGAGSGGGEPMPVLPKEPDPNLVLLLSLLFDMTAGVAGDHWSLKPNEADSLSMALDPVLSKYLGDFDMGCEVTLLLTAGMIIIPRVQASKQTEPTKEPVTNGKESDQSSE